MTTEADENGKSNLSHRRHSYALQDHTDEHLSETMISLEMSPMEERAENHPHMKYVPCCLRHDDGPPEATGLTLDFYARATVLMSSIFLGPALLQLATESAGCASEQDCDARVMGMKPSSLLSNIAVATGILASILMPTLGAIVDHTSYRLQVGTYSGYIISVVKGLEAMVSSKTWFYVAILQVFSGLLYYAHITTTYAYTADLTVDAMEQTKYNTYFYTVLYASTLIFMAQVLLLAFVFNQDDVGTARISQIITSLTSGSLFVFAWSFLFRNRPPSSTLQDHQSLWNVGFSKVFQTGREIYLHMPALRCLMGSVLFAESAMNTIVTVGTTYMSTFLDMTSSEIGFVFLVVLIMGIPGAKLGQLIALRLSPLISAKLSILCLLISTTLAAALLTGPQHKHYVVIFAVFWGLSLGWLHPMHTIMFIGLTPDDSRTEFMGIYIFSQQILSWLPALVFTILNEAGASMSIGLASLDIFFVFGLVSLQLMGSYDEVKKTPREIQVAMVDTELPSLS